MTNKPNRIVYQDDQVAHLGMLHDQILIIDTEDLNKITPYRWCVHYKNGTYRVQHTSNKGSPINLARFITNAPKGSHVDHKNHNTLDNRKCNLRVCTPAENSRNKQNIKQDRHTSIYKGVTCDRRNKGQTVYKSNISIDRKQLQIGTYSNEIDAALAYNEAAIKYYGDFACLNEVLDVDPNRKAERTIDGSYLKYRDKYWRKNRNLVENILLYKDSEIAKFKIGRPESECIVDTRVYEDIKDRHWELNENNQVVERKAGKPPIRLSKLIMPYNGVEFIVHKNGNKLDLRKANLDLVNNAVHKVIYRDDEVVHLRLFNNSILKVSAIDYDKVSVYRWSTMGKGGVESLVEGKWVNIINLIYNYDKTMTVYYSNGDKLDVRRSNIEFLSYREAGLRRSNRARNIVLSQDNLIATIRIDENIRVVIDIEDLERVLQYSWKFNQRKGYIETRSGPYKKHRITLSAFIMNTPNGYRTTYISSDRLDNRKSNLQVRCHSRV